MYPRTRGLAVANTRFIGTLHWKWRRLTSNINHSTHFYGGL